MTWAGEDIESGVMYFTEDGSPGSAVGLEGDVLTWNSNSFGSVAFQDVNTAMSGSSVDNFVKGVQASGGIVATFSVSDSLVATTTSSSYDIIPGMLIENLPSGDYTGVFNANIRADRNKRNIDFAFFVDEIEITESIRTTRSFYANQDFIITVLSPFAIDANQEVSVRWKRVTSGATWTIENRTFTILRSKNNVI